MQKIDTKLSRLFQNGSSGANKKGKGIPKVFWEFGLSKEIEDFNQLLLSLCQDDMSKMKYFETMPSMEFYSNLATLRNKPKEKK